MPATIGKDTVCSQYALKFAGLVRLNPNGSIPLAYPISLKMDDGNGGFTSASAPAGIFGKFGTVDMSAYVTLTQIKLKFYFNGKSDVITIPCVSGDFVTPTAATQTEIAAILNKATTGIGVAGNFPNIGYGFTASVDSGTGRLKIVGAATGPTTKHWLFRIDEDYDAGTGVMEADSVAAVLGLNRSFGMKLESLNSLSATQNVTDPETKQNNDAEGTVSTVTVASESTGYALSLECSSANPFYKMALAGGYVDAATGQYTPRPAGVDSPRFALFAVSRNYDEGSSSLTGQRDYSITIFPDCTAILNNNDKNSQDFNHPTFDITASDGADVPAGTEIFLNAEEMALFEATLA